MLSEEVFTWGPSRPVPLSIEQKTLAVLERIETLLVHIEVNTRPIKSSKR